MRLIFPHLQPGDTSIRTVSDYAWQSAAYDAIRDQAHNLRMDIHQRRQAGANDAEVQPFLEQLQELDIQKWEAMRRFFRCLPIIQVSRCPFCDAEIWMKVGLFGLEDSFWYHQHSDGREEVHSACPHLFCVDGALNLNNHQPIISDKTQKLYMAAEVPFVKPRVLNLPTMQAVIHSFPIADYYTAYPIVYFAEKMPKQDDFCIAWARQEYVDHHHASGEGVVMTGKRSDAQDSDLIHWIERGKLAWLDAEGGLQRMLPFPHEVVSGRRHPYTIINGQIRDLPNRTIDSKPEIHLER